MIEDVDDDVNGDVDDDVHGDIWWQHLVTTSVISSGDAWWQ